MLERNVLRPLAAGVAVCLAFLARPAAAQDEKADTVSRVWMSAGMLVGGTVLDGNAERGWERVGRPGPSFGGSIGLGFDIRQVGAAFGVDAAALKVGDRRGSSVALSAVLRYRFPKAPAARWERTIEAGYVHLGFGSARVTETELPPGLFTSAPQGDRALEDDLSLRGHGIRMGVSMERGWRAGTNVVLGLGADAVHFNAATYEGSSKALSNAGWGVLPRILVGVRIPALPLTVLIGSGSTRN